MTIEVNIKASDKNEISDVVALGSIRGEVTNKDRDAFKMSDYNLKKAAGKLMGKEPSDIYLKDPTAWGNLYSEYNWDPVRKTLKPISASVIGIETKPVIVAKQYFKNDSSTDVTYNASINHQVSNTVSSTWSVENEISVEQSISYKIDFIVAGAEGETSLSYTHSWGEEHSESQEITLGATSGVEVTLKPGQAVTAVLSANQGTMNVQVSYRTTLDGQVFINYPDTWNGHHFYGPYVNSVMQAGGLQSTLDAKEVLKIGFYGEGKITVYDEKTSEALLVAPTKFISS